MNDTQVLVIQRSVGMVYHAELEAVIVNNAFQDEHILIRFQSITRLATGVVESA